MALLLIAMSRDSQHVCNIDLLEIEAYTACVTPTVQFEKKIYLLLIYVK